MNGEFGARRVEECRCMNCVPGFQSFIARVLMDNLSSKNLFPDCFIHFVQLIEAETGQGMFCAMNLKLAKCLVKRVNGDVLVNLAYDNVLTGVI